MLDLSDDDVACLGAGLPVVWDGWLPPADVSACRRAIAALAEAERLTPAGVGLAGRHVPSVRGDHTAWLTETAAPPALTLLWPRFQALADAVNRAAWLGLQRFEVQLARYPGDGARYARHVDALSERGARRLTAIVYLQEGWVPAHGGALLAHTPEGPWEIAPHGGRLVMFLADRLPHEVLPSFAERLAVTAWFRGPVEVPWLEDPDVADPRSPGVAS